MKGKGEKMDRLIGKDLFLGALTREDCRTLWEQTEYDFEHPTEPPSIGLSPENADRWFEEIQRDQGKRHVRLGIFLNDGRIIGDAALQDLDFRNRSCSVGMGIARASDRGKGYGKQALSLLLNYGFRILGFERIWAATSGLNVGAQQSLLHSGFTPEGCERHALWLNGRYHDRLIYGMLREEWETGRDTQTI